MLARDVMTAVVVTVTPDICVEDIAKLLLERNISAVPVLDAAGRLVGIVSEGDLMRRRENETARRRA
jgi:CBS domain-containing protein